MTIILSSHSMDDMAKLAQTYNSYESWKNRIYGNT